MGIAAYNRGTRAIAEQIDQQLREDRQADLIRESKPRVNWFKAAIQSRLDREDLQFRIEDNVRRESYGLPTYTP